MLLSVIWIFSSLKARGSWAISYLNIKKYSNIVEKGNLQKKSIPKILFWILVQFLICPFFNLQKSLRLGLLIYFWDLSTYLLD